MRRPLPIQVDTDTPCYPASPDLLAPRYREAQLFVDGQPLRRQLLEIDAPGLTQLLGLPADHPVALSTSQAIAVGMLVWGVVVMLRARASPA